MFSVMGKGNLKVLLPNSNQKPTPITLENVYYSPHLVFTLISVGVLNWNGYDLHINGGKCIIQSPGQITLVRGLYHVTEYSQSMTSSTANAVSKLMTISKLHQKMGHVNHNDLQRMVKENMITGLDIDLKSKPDFCEACVKAKVTCKPFPKQSHTKHEIKSSPIHGVLHLLNL